MNTLLIGNFIALIGCLLMVAVGFIKDKRHILTAQCFMYGFLALSNFILGATSGFISGIASILRNLFFAKVKSSTKMKLIFILFQIAISFNPSSFSLLECLPIIACTAYTWYIDTESEITLKKVIMATSVCWVIYDFSYSNFVSMTFDLFSIASNLIGILMIQKSKKA